jgi:long-chain acyl-CoA synthetase
MVTTLCELLLNSAAAYPKDEYLLVKKGGRYTPMSMADFVRRIRHFSLGLRDLGFAAGQKLIILSENRPEWTMSDFAALCQGGISVPVYATLVPEQVRYLIDDSDATVVVFSDAEQGAKVEAVRSSLIKVKHFITFASQAPAGCLTFDEVCARGAKLDAAEPGLFEATARAVRPGDIASIIYTSGTTGLPKGVLLTHSNFISNIVTASTIIDFSDKDTVLSFLPLSHVLERMVTFTYIHKGCTIGYAECVDTVAQNLLEIRPHIMVSAPRVFEKIYAKVIDNILAESGLKRKIFFWALKTGKAVSRRKLAGRPVGGALEFKRKIAHKLVFTKILAKTGGRVRFFVSGGAPLSKDIAEFFHAIGLLILEGYGLTETSPVVALNTFERMGFGTVGPVIPGVEVKIAADGEILVKGPNVMQGYYKKPAETAEAFEDGWFKTGDIGKFDDQGLLVITDRKKDLIVTAGGKNVAPQMIENILKTNPYIANIVAIGDRRRFISALVVPNFDKLEPYAKAQGLVAASRAELVRNPKIVEFLLGEIDKATSNFASYERIKKIAVLDRDFEIGTGEMTPSLKVKRNIVQEKYKALLDALYAEDIA